MQNRALSVSAILACSADFIGEKTHPALIETEKHKKTRRTRIENVFSDAICVVAQKTKSFWILLRFDVFFHTRKKYLIGKTHLRGVLWHSHRGKEASFFEQIHDFLAYRSAANAP